MNKFIFVICSLFVLGISVFGQDALEKDLNKSFKKYDLVKLDNRVMLEKVKTEQPIKVQAYGYDFEFILTPNDLRAGNYRVVESNSSVEHELKKQAEITTYKGVLINDINSEVRFTITEGNIEGFIYTGDNKKFFVSQAGKFSSRALKNDAIVYGEDDLLKSVDLSNDTENSSQDIEGKIDLGLSILNHHTDSAATATTDLKVVEVATEADYQWVTQSGGASAANNEILGILNLVDGIYRRDLNLTIKVTFQHAWTTSDPYSAASTSALLDAFLGYWNSNYSRSQYPRDVAHLFTGKFNFQGIAYSSVACRNSQYAYGVTARSAGINHLITAHEIAHNLGADHMENSGSCATSLMNPIISSNVTGFCETSKSAIANYVSANGSCLSPTATTATPAPTPSCTYSITHGNQSFGAAGGQGSLAVSTQGACDWTAAANQNFVSITSGSNGSGNGTVVYSVAQNTEAGSRLATLTIAGQNFTIQQTGAVTNNSTATRFDFDGDGKANISVFRPSVGSWYISRSLSNSFYENSFGQAGDIPAAADFDGDRKTDIAVFRPSNGNWYYLNSSTGQFAAAQFGQVGDTPVPGDFDGDGRADISVFRPSNGTWFRINSSNGQFVQVQFGQIGDIPIIGDFDGDAKSDVAVFRPANGAWYVSRSSNNSFYTVNFGQSGDIPTAADFDGDGKTDVAVYRPETGIWYRTNSSTGAFFAEQFGMAEDKPAAADFDGDNRADLAVFRPSTGTWYLQRSTAGFLALQFGATGDNSIPTVTMP